MTIRKVTDLVARLEAIRSELDPDGPLRWAALYIEDLLDDCREVLAQEPQPQPKPLAKTWGAP